MIRATERLDAFERRYANEQAQARGFREALAVFEALWKEAASLAQASRARGRTTSTLLWTRVGSFVRETFVLPAADTRSGVRVDLIEDARGVVVRRRDQLDWPYLKRWGAGVLRRTS